LHTLIKYVLPTVWLTLIGYFVFASFFLPEAIRWGPGVTPFWGRVVVVTFWLGGVLVAWSISRPLKRVSAGGGIVEARGLFRTMHLRAADIEKLNVRGDWNTRSRPIVEIHLRDGRRIDFLPLSKDAVETLERMLRQLTAPRVRSRSGVS
jgi:hypothetical protein